jgi:hypothetical protein
LRAMPAGVWRSATRPVASHRLFSAALFLALLLRLDAELGYRWQSWFNDSFTYVKAAVTLTPETTRPSGYAVYLRALSPAHSYLLVTATQHLMGLLIAVMMYAVARHRFGAPSWLAVLATLPLLFDGFELELEHLIMADTLFLFLAMAGITVALWTPRPSWRACLAAGLLLGLSATVRSTGLPLLAVFVIYLLVTLLPARSIRWRSLSSGAQPEGPGGRPPGGYCRSWRSLAAGLAVGVAAFGVPLAGYEAWYHSAHGEFALTDSTGVFLYSRVMTFADCSRMSLPADLRVLCTSVPPDQRPNGQDYIWKPVSPLLRLGHPEFSPAVNKLAERFAIKAIEAQPFDYAGAVWDDTVRSFEWNRSVFPNAQTYDDYLFGYTSPHIPVSPFGGYPTAEGYYVHGDPATAIVNPFAGLIRTYQRWVWLPGTVYGLILLAGLYGIAARWRRGGREALLPWLCSVTLIVAPAATAEFDYRYVTTAVPFACLAVAVAFGSARLARHGAGGSPDGRLADAGDDQRDLAPDTAA